MRYLKIDCFFCIFNSLIFKVFYYSSYDIGIIIFGDLVFKDRKYLRGFIFIDVIIFWESFIIYFFSIQYFLLFFLYIENIM